MSNTQKLEARIAVLQSTEELLWGKFKAAEEVRDAAVRAWNEVRQERKDAERELEIETLVAQRLCGVDA